MPRALEISEIPTITEEFRAGAARALAAGFDGVEIHGGNGYLPDQFLQDGTKKRTGAYGGPIENRARFMLEITEAAISVWGADRVGVCISPSGEYGSMSDSDPDRTFGYLTKKFSDLGLGYLHIVEPGIKGIELIHEGQSAIAAEHLRPIFNGTIIAAGGFDRQSAEEILEAGTADLVAFGRHFISNPDLSDRLRNGIALTPCDRATFYGADEIGYTDYSPHGLSALAA